MPQGPLAINIATTGGSRVPLKADSTGSLIIAQNGAYYDQTLAGAGAMAANPSAVTTSAGLATTYVGICISNPAGNTKNVILTRCSGTFVVAPSTITTMGLITGYLAAGVTVHTTALTPFSGLIGTGAAPTAKVDSACTLVGTPAWTMFLAQCGTATTAAGFVIDLQGAVILPPGAYAAIGTTIAGPASGFQGSFSWLEL